MLNSQPFTKLLPVMAFTIIAILAFLGFPKLVLAGNSSYPIGPICSVHRGPDSFGNYIDAPVPCDWTCVGNLECWGNDYEGPINHNGDGVSQKFSNRGNIYHSFDIGVNQTVNVKFWVYTGNPSATCLLGIEDGTGGGWQWWSYSTPSDGAGWHLFDVTRNTTSSSINVMASNSGGGNCYFDDFNMTWNPNLPVYTPTPFPPTGYGATPTTPPRISFTPTPTPRTPLTPTIPPGSNSCSACTVVNGGPINSSSCISNQYLYVQTSGYAPGQCGTSCIACPAGTVTSSTGCGCVSTTPSESSYTPPSCSGNIVTCCGCPNGGAYECNTFSDANACLPDAWGCAGVPACGGGSGPGPSESGYGPSESSYESSYESTYESYYESYYQPAYKSFLKTEGGDVHSDR